MARVAVSPYLVDGPAVLGLAVKAPGDLAGAAGLDDDALGLLPLVPGVVLGHAAASGSGRLTLRWCRLPHAPVLHPDTGPTTVAVPLTGPVAQSHGALSHDPVTIVPDAPLGAALTAMRAREIRHLPVVGSPGRLVGIVTERDLLRAIMKTLPSRPSAVESFLW